MRRLALLVLFTLGLTACQTPFSPDSPLTPVPEQSTLVLHQPLTIPPKNVSLWFQNGQPQSQHELDHYYPHCKFETLTMQDTPKTIQPDRFMIHKVVRWDDYATQPVRYTALQLGTRIGIGSVNDAAPSHVNTATEMFLRSDAQPDVYRMICSQWEDAAQRDHVTINQIRQTLGPIFTLELPAKRSIKETGASMTAE